MNYLLCPWEPATFLFISSNVPLLINYSHFIAIFSVMAVSLLVFANDPKNLLSRLFLFFASIFSIWALLDVMLWATNDPAEVMFSWSLQVLIEPVTYAMAYFLFYLYLNKKLPPFKYQVLTAAILMPLILLLPTTFNLEALQLSSCESIEGPIAKYYTYILNAIFTIMILITGIVGIPKLKGPLRRSAIYFTVGLVTFLLSFTSGNIISSFTDDWTISQYGLFGMPVFASLIAYNIVRFNSFRIQMTGAQMLVVILWALVCSLLFVDTELFNSIVLVTLIFATVAGFLLIRSVRQEFKQKQEIEKLAEKLSAANIRLKERDRLKSEFVSIASHQLRSPLTAIRGYSSMLLEGSFGKLPAKAEEAIVKIGESSRLMALSVEDYLNVSRIESGNMKYNYSKFDAAEIAKKLVDQLRPEATKRGLLITYKSNVRGGSIVKADIGKTTQIIQNLIDNSIKYTKEGSVEIVVNSDVNGKTLEINIIDTGIGMSKETKEGIFVKFERASNANSVNVTGTGLGLFVADTMAKAMGGQIRADSEGEEKGSTFTLQLPLVK